MSIRGGIYHGPDGELLYGNGEEVEPLSPYKEPEPDIDRFEDDGGPAQ